MNASIPSPDTILFDLGGVLIDWNPRYLYRPFFEGDEQGMERFLHHTCAAEWNHEIDAGKPFAEAVVERQRLFPEQASLIALWRDGWAQMLREALADSVAVLSDLRSRGYRLLALTNWSAETFPIARERFAFLEWFQDIVVSGEVRLAKPDPRIFQLTIERCALHPSSTLFIDDSIKNVEAARGCGLQALHFRDAAQLRRDLLEMGLLA